MSKIDDVRKEMMAALKAGDKPRKEALSMLLSALKAAFIDKRADLTEDEENAVVLREIKEAPETLDPTPKDRADIIAECKLTLAVYSGFAPPPLGADEIRAVIAGSLKDTDIPAPPAQATAPLTKTLMPRVKGKADGNAVNRLVSELFA